MALIGSRPLMDMLPRAAMPTASIAPTNVPIDPSLMAPVRRPGIMDRIGATLDQPGMRAALLRAGAATIDGGIGAGIATGAQFLDQRRAQDIDQQQFAANQAQRQQQIDQTGDYQQGILDNQSFRSEVDLAELEEARRAKMAGERLTQRQQDLTAADNAASRDVTMRGQDIGERNNIRSNSQSDTNSRRSYDASIYGTDAGVFNAGQRAAGIGSKGAKMTVTRKPTPERTEGGFMGIGGRTVPAQPGMSISVDGAAYVPPEAIELLKANPGLAPDFERKYGRGTAMLYLGGQ